MRSLLAFVLVLVASCSSGDALLVSETKAGVEPSPVAVDSLTSSSLLSPSSDPVPVTTTPSSSLTTTTFLKPLPAEEPSSRSSGNPTDDGTALNPTASLVAENSDRDGSSIDDDTESTTTTHLDTTLATPDSGATSSSLAETTTTPPALADDTTTTTTLTTLTPTETVEIPPEEEPLGEPKTETELPDSEVVEEASEFQHYLQTFSFGVEQKADLFSPGEIGVYPFVALVHGGSWIGGDRSQLHKLANDLASAGVVTLSIDYRDALEGGVFPLLADDVACGVRLAHRIAPHFTANPNIVVLGYSAGAHLSTLVAFSVDRFGESCPETGSQLVAGVIGLAGPYNIDLIPLLPALFIGGSRQEKPAEWEAANPFTYIGSEPLPPTLLLHGTGDRVAPILFSRALAQELTDTEQSVELIELDADHNTITQPENVTDSILSWLQSDRF